MNTRRTGGDNGYQTAEDFANEGNGYQPANKADINSVIHDRSDGVVNSNALTEDNDDETAGNDVESGPEETEVDEPSDIEDKDRNREGYDNGSNDTEEDTRFAASTGKMS